MIFGNFEKVNESADMDLEFSDKDYALMMEAAILENCTEEEIAEFLADGREVNSALSEGVLLERTIVRLDKKAKLSKAQKMAIFTIAKEKKDPLMKKLLTVWRLERGLEAKLQKKYASAGLARAKKAMRDKTNSASKLIRKVTDKVASQFQSVAPKK